MTLFTDSPIFIMGIPRSGTSLLMGLLDGHPDVLVAPYEMQYFQKFLPAMRRQSADIAAKETLLRHFLTDTDYHRRYLQDISADSILEIYQSQQPQTAVDHLNATLYAYAVATEQNTASCWLEKTPFNEQYAAEIQTSWPDAQCIHVLRDPRALFNTYKKRQPKTTIPKFAATWLKTLHLAQVNKARFGQQQYLLVRYEDLVEKSADTMQKIIQFLNFSPHACLTQATKRGGVHAWKGNSAHESSFHGQLQTRSAHRWRDELSQKTIYQLESLLAPSMSQLNYQLTKHPANSASYLMRLRLRLAQLRV